MAQTSTAAREPSMEEILASIRRIIEDSDVARHPNPVTLFPQRGVAPDYLQTSTPEKETIEDLSPPVDDNTEAKLVFAEEPSLRGSISDFDELEAELEAELDSDDDPVLSAENDDEREDEWIPRPLNTRRTIITSPDSENLDSEEVAVSQTTVSENTSVTHDEVVMTALIDEVESVSKEHILSKMTERQVASAFENLTHAVQAEPRRSFDEIAAEIMRPMLQEWMDKNLPDLVERLVHEEIERIVRRER